MPRPTRRTPTLLLAGVGLCLLAVAAVRAGISGGAGGRAPKDRTQASGDRPAAGGGGGDTPTLAPAGLPVSRGPAVPGPASPSAQEPLPAASQSDATGSASALRSEDVDPASESAAPESAAATVFAKRGSWRVLRGSGGANRTNDACERAITWLCVHAEPDGGWCEAGGPYLDAAFPETLPAPEARRSGRATVLSTAWGTLALLARGYTPRSEGPFAEVARRAVAALRARQAADGTLRDEGRLASNEAQALGALALLEAYGMTGSAALRGPASAAVSALAMRLPELLAEARRTEDGAFTLATVFRFASTLAAMRADRTPGFETSALPPSDPYERAADAYLAEAADRDVRGTPGDRIARIVAQIFRRRDLRRTPALREAVEQLVTEVMGAPADRAPDARTVPYTYMLVREVQLVHTAPAYSGLAYPFLTAQILEGDYAGLRGTWNPWGRSTGSDTRATATALASWTFSSDLVILPEPPSPPVAEGGAPKPGTDSDAR